MSYKSLRALIFRLYIHLLEYQQLKGASMLHGMDWVIWTEGSCYLIWFPWFSVIKMIEIHSKIISVIDLFSCFISDFLTNYIFVFIMEYWSLAMIYLFNKKRLFPIWIWKGILKSASMNQRVKTIGIFFLCLCVISHGSLKHGMILSHNHELGN